MKVYLLIKTTFARDGGALDINCFIYKTYDLAIKAIKKDLTKFNKTRIKTFTKNGKFDSAELINENYPWGPQATWYLYEKPIIAK